MPRPETQHELLWLAVKSLGADAPLSRISAYRNSLIMTVRLLHKKGATGYGCPSSFAQHGKSELIVDITFERFGQEQDACDQR
jgi:hypothetical protein